MPSNSISAAIFAGEFRHALDPKKRVTIPAKWRTGEADEFYLIAHHRHACIVAMPPEEFMRVRERAEAMPGPAREAFLTMLGAKVQHCTVDKSGRLLLSDDQLKKAGISSEVVLAGGVSKFQVWSPENWSAYVTERDAAFMEGADFVGL